MRFRPGPTHVPRLCQGSVYMDAFGAAVVARVKGEPLDREGEQAVGDTRMEVDVVVEGGAEAVQEGDGTEARAQGRSGRGVRHEADRVAEEPLDLVEKNPREGGDGRGPVGEDAPQAPVGAPPLGHRDHALPHGHRRDDAGGELKAEWPGWHSGATCPPRWRACSFPVVPVHAGVSRVRRSSRRAHSSQPQAGSAAQAGSAEQSGSQATSRHTTFGTQRVTV